VARVARRPAGDRGGEAASPDGTIADHDATATATQPREPGAAHSGGQVEAQTLSPTTNGTGALPQDNI
jgi:hypothetical protein